MKRKFSNTKVSVKMRKAENEEIWYLYLEAYPVYNEGNDKPQRKREPLNRSISTPRWDKKHPTRGKSGNSYQPLRDLHGVIQCKSDVDKESCFYADEKRKVRQEEYDKASLYSDQEKEIVSMKAKANENFIDYFESLISELHINGSKSIFVNWKRVHELIKIFCGSDTLLFSEISTELIERFKRFLSNAPCGGGKSGTLSRNSASTYFSIFRASLKQAFKDGYFPIDISAKVAGINGEERRREFLTEEEVEKLAETECDMPILKRASLFAILTGIRLCDIQKMKWSEIQKVGDEYRLNFTQKKTKGVEYLPINKQAYSLCGEPKDPDCKVFEDLPSSAWISKPLERWIKSAGITKHITFHCFRHTFATLQLLNGTDIYTISKMLGHTKVETTQIYTKVVDEKKSKAANSIHIKGL